MHSDSCFIIDGESRVIAGKEVHEERELIIYGLSLSRGWLPNVVIHMRGRVKTFIWGLPYTV